MVPLPAIVAVNSNPDEPREQPRLLRLDDVDALGAVRLLPRRD